MRLFAIIIGLFVFSAVAGQYKGPSFPIEDKWFNEYGKKGLQEGDRMPDIPLGTVLNNTTGKKRFADLKGKLVILDFWSTGCTSCMAKFPEMEQLQKEFGNQIQIILVNAGETGAEIKERIGQDYLKRYKLPNLPCIVSSRSSSTWEELYKNSPLIRLFPTLGVPHHVWIDAHGIIRMRGGAENTYAAKIKTLLAAKPIEFLKNSSTLPDLNNDKNARYYQQLGYMRNTPVSYGSFITPYTNEITGAYGAVREIVDSTHATRITQYINQSLWSLYSRCLSKDSAMITSYAKLLFSTDIYDFTKFPEGMDTPSYISEPWIIQRPLKTEEMARSMYCYEQVVPMAMPEKERYQMMMEDLNRYFKVHYGITGSVQSSTATYYELIRTSDRDKIGVAGSGHRTEVVKGDGMSLIFDFEGRLVDTIPALFRNKNVKQPPDFLYDTNGRAYLIFNGTGWIRDKHVALKIPLEGLKSIIDLRRLLQVYDLDLVERREELPFYVFTRVN